MKIWGPNMTAVFDRASAFVPGWQTMEPWRFHDAMDKALGTATDLDADPEQVAKIWLTAIEQPEAQHGF